jgi:putative transposase
MRYKACLCGDAGARLGQLIEAKVEQLGLQLLEYRILPNRVYLSVSATPNLAPHHIACQLKAYTSRELRAEFVELTRIPTLWTRAYVVFGGDHVTADDALAQFDALQPPPRPRGRPRRCE